MMFNMPNLRLFQAGCWMNWYNRTWSGPEAANEPTHREDEIGMTDRDRREGGRSCCRAVVPAGRSRVMSRTTA